MKESELNKKQVERLVKTCCDTDGFLMEIIKEESSLKSKQVCGLYMFAGKDVVCVNLNKSYCYYANNKIYYGCDYKSNN